VVAERLAGTGVSASHLADAYASALVKEAQDAVGLKSVMAYRFGLDFDPERPASRDVARAAGEWLRRCAQDGRARLDDPVLLRHVVGPGWISACRCSSMSGSATPTSCCTVVIRPG
jgi:uncharacterized protein